MTHCSRLQQDIADHLQHIYHNILSTDQLDELTEKFMQVMGFDQYQSISEPEHNNWNEKDVVLITYGDSIVSEEKNPLQTLHHFLEKQCQERINSVHILPFFPFSSDSGFSVMDYYAVNHTLGSWQDIENIAADYRLMADLVINHCSRKSVWFKNFLAGTGHGHDFFLTATEEDDTRMVVRPRTSPLLQKVVTQSGTKHVWCTFSHDQIDLDFKNPKVLVEFIKIIREYLNRGVRLFRLDAVAFLWKESGTGCINLPQTHEVVRLVRTIIEHAQPDGVVITETNIPVQENLSYFGDTNEANWVYNFPLPPLLINTLVTGDCSHLKSWLMSMPPAYNGTAFFNFIASHDGVGLRPVEDILTRDELFSLTTTMESFGGRISWRTISEHEKRPYEMNISLYDALKGTTKGADQFNHERFICAHAIMLGLEGIPGIYIHSLLATGNDYDGVAATGENRAINRHKWELTRLEDALDDNSSQHFQTLTSLLHLIEVRTRQPAFHPNATQFTLQLRPELLGFWRQSLNRRQSIFCISNVTASQQDLTLSTINLIDNQPWFDLISGEQIDTSKQILSLQPYQTVWLTNQYQQIPKT